VPWAVTFPDSDLGPVHPAQLYSAFNAFFIAGILLAYHTMPHAPGRAFALMLILKGASRFMLEILRSEPAVLGPMSFSMVVSALVLVPGGVAFWFLCGYLEKSRGEPLITTAPTSQQ